MRRAIQTLRRALPWVAVTLLLTQLAAMITLTVMESLRRKHRKLRRFPHTSPKPLAVGENEVTVYTFGKDLYADMLKAIDEASDVIHFETYIWKGDTTGQAFKQALINAANRGVEVNVIWDDFANLVVPRAFFRMPDNIRVVRHPAVPVPWSPRKWGRDHRKLLVVDRKLGFVGGYNIGTLYATGWRDTHARVVGPAVAEFENAFVDFWNDHVARGKQPLLSNNMPRQWHSELTLHRNTPRIQVYPIRNMYLEAIDRASDRIWLTHAYLIPDDDLVAALRHAAQRGVDVRIIVPAKSNHTVADWLSRGFYTDLLRSGIRLFLYQAAMVHSKTATIDGTWATIGTANLDRLSLLGNYEVNLEILDDDVAAHMEDVFRVDLSNTIEMTLDEWHKRSFGAKATELLLSPWRPLF
ncbi:phospholipase D-like domain-containing protein [Tessaracoccus sp. OS52]|uniref:phospholipase D-like domain-containing protein n=1 Tax=Tessaracoccus sp. OS52 TaxID=2886691 RepID=UPI001D120F16|nr:phospholipase D-like domain-containing protein [Tessaracoccus sp. OS52]MCC2592301.1 phospholipase D-like domain-containing protein [Tessaracoccus sp. OS52]